MPKIRTYEQQVGLTAPEVRSNVSTETSGLVGKSLMSIGESVTDFGETVEKYKVKQDIVKTGGKLSNLKAFYNQRIQEDSQKGVIDAQKIYDEYLEEAGKLTAETKRGQDFLSEQSSSLGTDIVKSASIAQSTIAGKLAVEEWNNTINVNSNTLQSSPAEFDSVIRSTVDTLEADVQNGTLDRTEAEKRKRLTGEQYAQSAVRGWSQISAETAENLLNQGVYDKYLNPDQKAALFSTIKTYKNAEETEKLRLQKIEEDRQVKVSEAWEQDNLDNLNNKTLTTKQILQSPLKANRKIQYLNMLKTNLKETIKTDPTVKNDLIRKVLLPEDDPKKITSAAQLYNYVGKGLTITDVKQISSFMDSTPDGIRMKSNRKLLMQQAENTLAKKDPLTGMPDPQGAYNLSLYTNALMDAEQKVVKEGKDPSVIYDPTSKDYFGNQIFKFQSTPQERFQRQIKFIELSSPGGTQGSTKPKESAEDLIKRLGL